jgi:uncharacterized protein YbjT (DUF2867 family)
MRPDPITVFGGTGFLGSVIVHELVNAGHRVRIACRRPSLPASLRKHDPVELIRADIRDDTAVARALEGSGGAVNAVSLYAEHHDLRFTTIHVEGAARLARSAREAGLERIVQISGIGADMRSRSAYVRARAEGESAVTREFPTAVIVRPSVLFGPNDAFLRTLADLSRLPVIPLFGRGDTRLQPVHVADVARAVAELLGEAEPARYVFELGGPEIMRYREILTLVLTHLKRQRRLQPVPFPVWHALARLGSLLPNPPLTRDQVILMQQDNVASRTAGSFDDLGIVPRALSDSLSDCLPAK